MFSALLKEIQRIRGGDWVDVSERMAFERFLSRYDGTSHREVRSAIAALFGRNPEEAAAIERAFDMLYLTEAEATSVAPSSQPPPQLAKAFATENGVSEPPEPAKVAEATEAKPRRTVRLVVMLLAAVLACASILYLQVARDSTGDGPEVTPPTLPQADPKPPEGAETERSFWPPPEPAVQAALAVAALGLLFFALRRSPTRTRQWKDRRATRFAQAKGQRTYHVESKRRRTSFAIERLRSVLERVAGRSRRGHELDVAETVRLTAENARVELAFSKRDATGRILVLRDVGPSMLRWRARIERFVEELRVETVVDVLYFKDSPTAVSAYPGRQPQPLRSWTNFYGGRPLIVLSDGKFFEQPSVTNTLLRESLEPWPVRVLFHPLEDQTQWPEPLRRSDSELPAFPLSRSGYRALLRWLPQRSRAAHARFQPAEPPLWPSDVFRLLAMLSFLPKPSGELAELLRSRLLPEAPARILQRLDAVLRPTVDSKAELVEARRKLREWFALSPADAAEYEKFWRDFVPEPPAGTPAHQRYARDRAVMILHLGDRLRDASELARLVSAFIESPLADDWYRALDEARQEGKVWDVRSWRTRHIVARTQLVAAFRPNAIGPRGSLPTLRRALGVLAIASLVLLTGTVVSPSEITRTIAPTGGSGGAGLAGGSGGTPNPSAICAQGSVRCGDSCVDTQTDQNNCGTCGQSCANGTTCIAGECRRCTDPSLTECNGRCVNVTSDASNCGGCGRSCRFPGARGTCSEGKCSMSCNPGRGNCDGARANGCETSVLDDAKNCGKCGVECPTPKNGTAACADGRCKVLLCNPGFQDCDRDPATGCETYLDTSSRHCGACGNVCPTGSTCRSGRCALTCVSTCAATYKSCTASCGRTGQTGSRGVRDGNFFGAPKAAAPAANAPAPATPAAAPKEPVKKTEPATTCMDDCERKRMICEQQCGSAG